MRARRRIADEARDRPRERLDVARRDEEAVDAVADDHAAAIDVGPDEPAARSPPSTGTRLGSSGRGVRPAASYEAMSCRAVASGLPLVGPTSMAAAWYRDGVNGLLVPPPRRRVAHAGDLAPRRRSRSPRPHGRGSRDVAVAEFEEEAILDGYEAVYRRLGVVE